MSRPARGWGELLTGLGRAGAELARSEAAALGRDLSATGRGLGRSLLYLALALFALFWALGAVAYLLLELLSLWLPRWGSALALVGLLLVVALLLAMVGRSRWRRLEKPAATVRRRLHDHADWWRSRVLAELPEPGAEDDAGGEGL